ncbi:hypothetical protein GCM10009332_28450 [Shewanella gelidii]|uniref:MFS transporter n=1 Tax=Shewanella gelidii TaxID=1642821 RepID=A0A917JZ90_9GAMM|nr:hypothetical protein GCM10009332_28450 [Shewanella gelidii]
MDGSLLNQKRFLPYFVTQFLGALNDNLYKNVILLLVAFSQVDALPISSHLFVNLAAGLFILPFFLFSAHAGLLADNVDKSRLIRHLKLLELIIMSLAAAAILSQQYLFMLLLLFFTGCQSAYFGPVKYSLLPQALLPNELVKGNAWVEMGTFIAILMGTLWAGLLVSQQAGATLPAAMIVLLALAGYMASRQIPATPIHGSIAKVKFAPFHGLLRTVQQARTLPATWVAILAISWFWFLGATYLTQFANYTKLHLQSGPTVVSLLLALFSLGIGIGSMLCERLSRGQVKLTLIFWGGLGLSLFGCDFALRDPVIAASQAPFMDAAEFIMQPSQYRLMFDLFMIGVSGGLFIVPLYSFIQATAPKGRCAQLIAANNIINALFMVVSAIFAMVLLSLLQSSIPQLFLATSVLNVVTVLYVAKHFDILSSQLNAS